MANNIDDEFNGTVLNMLEGISTKHAEETVHRILNAQKEQEKQMKEAEIQKQKNERAEQMDKIEQEIKQLNQQTISEAESIVGNKTSLNNFCQSSQLDEITVASAITALKDDYDPEKIKQYLAQIKPEEFKSSKYNNTHGVAKLAADMTKGLEKFLKNDAEQENNEKKTLSKIDENLQPERIAYSQESINNRRNTIKEASRKHSEVVDKLRMKLGFTR